MPVQFQNPINSYVGNGVTTVFAYTFKILDSDDLDVYLDGVIQVAGYSVSGVGDAAGGSVTFSSAPATDVVVRLERAVSLDRETDYLEGGQLAADTLDADIDRTVMMAQDINAKTIQIDSDDKWDAESKVIKNVATPVSGNDAVNKTYADATMDAAAASATAAAASAAAALASEGNAADSEDAAALSESNAAASEAAAAISAASAQQAADSVMWRDVVFITSADSPYTLTDSHRGKLVAVDASSGAVVVNLPEISTLSLVDPFVLGVKKTDASGNSVTINRAGADTIDAATSKVISTAGSGTVLVPDADPNPDVWTSADFGATAGNLTVDRFTGDGSDTTFVLSVDPGTENNTSVYIDGVYQQKDQYSLTGPTLTFSSAPPAGSDNIEVVSGTTLSIGTPADGTVTLLKLAASVAQALVPTGAMLEYDSNDPPGDGWLLCDNAEYNIVDHPALYAKIGIRHGGDGITTFRTPDHRGRVPVGEGTGVVTESGVDAAVDIAGDTFAVASNNAKWITGMPVVLTLASGTITGLTSGNTYYVIRDSDTTIKLASTLANAQNGTGINLTAKSSPTWDITHTYTERTLGEYGGEESHAMSSTELLAHTHLTVGTAANVTASGGGTLVTQTSGLVSTSGSRGGNAAANIMQPYYVVKKIIKT